MNQYTVIHYTKGDIIGTCIYLEEAGMRRDPKTGKYRRLAKFKCQCGNEFITTVSNVKRGNTKSCGCYNKKRVLERNTKHGLCKHPLYRQWQNLRNRCYNKNIEGYKDYGAKGIKVCEEWRNEFLPFYKWAAELNWRPGLSIDRINSNGNYEPTNCRLATDKQQARNRRTNIIVEYEGEKMCMTELCERLGLNYSAFRTRVIKRGWSLERAISTERRCEKNDRLNGQ